MPCIYCGSCQDLSESDIIPDSMTNGRIINPNVCHVEHNSKFSDKFEEYVFNKLSFLLNVLDIKSNKANEYPKYPVEFKIDDVTYTSNKISKEKDIFSKEVSTNSDKTHYFGKFETLKKIAISKGVDPKSVQYMDVNQKKIEFRNEIRYEVFFETQMFRLAAKIAFEWYCLRNNVTDYNDEFKEIIDYITNGPINQNDTRVTMVNNEIVCQLLDKYENSGGHVLIGYIDKDQGISIIVDFLSIGIYNVKICDKIPAFCENNMLMQHITIDGSGNKKSDCLCKNDYNGLTDVYLDVFSSAQIHENKSLQAENNNVSLDFIVCDQVPDDILSKMSMVLTILPMLEQFQIGLEGTITPNQITIDRIINRFKQLLQTSVFHPKAVKRFIKDNIKEDFCLNPIAGDGKSIFLYYILYEIGNCKEFVANSTTIKQFIESHLGGKEIDVNLEKTQELLDIMLSDPEYKKKVFMGAESLKAWND